MKVLWLGSSNDVNDVIPKPQRTIAVAATGFTRATGVPIEVEFRKIWPGPELPGLVERWLGRYEPDMVVIHTNSYWFTYESTPEKLRRALGPAGPMVAGIGSRAAENPTLSQNGVFRVLRRTLTRTIGGDVAIKGPACVAMMEEMIHRIVAREDTVLLVRGPHYPHDSTGTVAGRQRAFDACRVVSDGLEIVCERLHVAYWKKQLVSAGEKDSDDLLDDGLHISPREHAAVGEKEAEWMVKAWRQAHPAERSDP